MAVVKLYLAGIPYKLNVPQFRNESRKKWIFQIKHEHCEQICSALIFSHISMHSYKKYYTVCWTLCAWDLSGYSHIEMKVQKVRWNSSNIRLTFSWKIFRYTIHCIWTTIRIFMNIFSGHSFPYILQVVFMKRGHILEFMLCMRVIKCLHLLLWTNSELTVWICFGVALFSCRF